MTAQHEVVDINLFAGAGGFALGLRLAGFAPKYLYEIDEVAQKTLCRNGLTDARPPDWDDHRGDVTKVDWSRFAPQVRLLAAGVPCQPFSRGGNHLAESDGRNQFPELLRAVCVLQPKTVLAENVHGLLRNNFSDYFNYITLSLANPSTELRRNEDWYDHNCRLTKRATRRGYEPEYEVKWAVLNAADYGVPQIRRRVFIAAGRGDLGRFNFPTPTHSRNALLRTQLSGDYWERHRISKPRHLRDRFRASPPEDGLKPWVTIRDTIQLLPTPAASEAAAANESTANHWIIPGARSYAGHDGSDRDWPSKTIKAGVHGVPGGENTIRMDDGAVRYLTLREAAAIQSFPENHIFEGARLHVTRQIGNAVPRLLAAAISRRLLKMLRASET